MNTSSLGGRTCLSLLVASVLTLCSRAADVRVYLQYNPNQKAAVQAQLPSTARVHHEFEDLNALVVTLPEAARNGLQRQPAVAMIEDDPRRGYLSQVAPYGVTMVQAPVAVAAGATGAGVKIGVVDSGVLHVHEDLAAVAISGEPDFGPADARTWYRDILSHGTHVVGTLAAANNSLGVIGVSPGAVGIHMVKVFGDDGSWVYSSDLLAACRAASVRGCRVISMSLGGGRASRMERTGLDDLFNNRGALLVAAAGNDGTTALSYPASYDSVISVAAIDSTMTVASFSQQNAQVELAAPGVAVLSTVSYVDNTYVAVGASNLDANHVENSSRGTVSAPLVYGGLGTSADAAWSGKVVLLDRGTNTFNEKVQNVRSSGGVACIIANNVDGNFIGTLGDGNSATIPAVSVSLADGPTLKAQVGAVATVSSTLTQPATNGYDAFEGTSMATPHVSATAALIWSKYPGATNTQVRQSLDNSALDLGAVGRDNAYGFGLVQAKAALDALAAANPGTDSTPPVISNLTATITNARNGSFEITWTTNEPATTDLQLNGSLSLNSTRTTTHKRSIRGTRGTTYIYSVFSTDATGNTSGVGPNSITLP